MGRTSLPELNLLGTLSFIATQLPPCPVIPQAYIWSPLWGQW